MNKKIVGAITSIALISALGSGCVIAENDNIKVTYDGQTINFNVQPKIINDSVMVPMRTIFETFGAKVKWEGETQTITAKRKSKTIAMTVGSTEMTKNEETYSYDTAPIIEDGSTLVPIRAISELLGLDVDWVGSDKTVEIVTPTSDDDVWKENTGTIDLDTMNIQADGINVADNVITISDGGDYEVIGTLASGQIVVDTTEKVKLRLSGMSLTNQSGSPLYIKNADKAYITLTENTENYLTDGESYTSGDENEKACVTSRDNLEIKGNGSLTVVGKYNHGIDGSDSIEIGNGNINITAKNDGIHANDTLAISGGVLNITAEGDGIQADEIVDITGGTVNVTTTGEIPVSANIGFGGRMREATDFTQMTDEDFQNMREEMQKQMESQQTQEMVNDSSEDVTSKGIKADWLMDISGGEITVNSTDHSIHCASDINIIGGIITLSSESKKGISAHGDIVIDDGEITIEKSTEGIESKRFITINGGDIDITASDDGMNAGGNGMDDMFGGQMTPPGMPSVEGITPPDKLNGEQRTSPDMTNSEQSDKAKGERIKSTNTQSGEQKISSDNINGEPMTLPNMTNGEPMTPSDNQTQSGDRTLQQGGRGQGGFGGNMNSNEISTEHHIQINGGDIYINAQGDGIDSNGSLVIDGGKITVDGPTGGGDSALDTDGAFMINGGEVIAVSAIGIDEAPNSYSTQNVVKFLLSQSSESGKTIEVRNSDGQTIASHTPVKQYQSFIYSSSQLKTGEEYTIYVDGEVSETFRISEVITSVGTSTQGGFGGRGGGKTNDNSMGNI